MSGPVRTAASAKSDVGTPAGTLRLGREGDAFERAADAAAERTTGHRSSRRGAAPTGERRVDAHTEGYLRTLGGGRRLPAGVRSEMERSLGWSFGDVRIHDDPAAARSARRLGAKAYTHGRDVVFGAGQWAPHTGEGRRLIAHELTHVVQQGAASSVIQRSPAAGSARPVVEGELEPPERELLVGPRSDAPDLQTDNGGETETATEAPPEPETGSPAPDAASPAQAPAPTGPAAPTLTVTPGDTLERGEQLTAELAFTPNGGETMRVTGWRYTTARHGTVNRARASAAELQWQGTMAVSGTLMARFRITPDGGREGPEETLTEDITVEDREGTDWEAEVTDEPEGELGGQPSPPRLFRQLGRHIVPAPVMPALTLNTIPDGPNTGMRFVESLTAGTFISRPRLHPDLRDPTSRFMTFHVHPGRLYKVHRGRPTLIPATEYSNLSTDGGIDFDVPDATDFMQRHGMLRVTARSGRRNAVLQDAWWGLDPNEIDGDIEILDDAAIRGALRIGTDASFTVRSEAVRRFRAHDMMQAADIVTGTQSHEYVHGTHSHRANFHAMMRALDPERKIESRVQGIRQRVNFDNLMRGWWRQIVRPNHELVDEEQSKEDERFVAIAGETMAGVNTDPDSGQFLGNVWNIPADQPMR